MRNMKKIVILGAGYAGILTAKKLAKRLKKNEEVSITLIDRNPFHTMLTELHEVAAGRVEEDSIRISLDKVFAKRKVTVAVDEITDLNLDARQLTGKQGIYSYDYLVIAAGSKPTYFGVPGAEYAYPLWSYDDAVNLRERIHSQFRAAFRETNPERRKVLLSFFVVGAGFTGVEMIGELAEYVPILCEEYGIPQEEVRLCNVDILKRTVPILPEKLSGKVERRLQKMGVKLLLGSNVVSIGENYIETETDGKTVRHDAGTVVWAAGIESAGITAQAAQSLESAKRGRLKTDEFLRAVGHEEVYVAGDNLMYIPEGETDPVPQMVENCEQSADIVAHNVVAAINGGECEAYHPKFHGVMVCVGGRYGVARVGLPNHMFNLPSFLAMFSKHFINVIYFIQVLGWNKVFSYLRHEFFTIRHCRSFLGGHFSNRTPSFLLVPLRVWLGAVWVFEGIMKIVEGWFKSPMLDGFFGGANSWYNSILQTVNAPLLGNMGNKGAELISSATEVAGEATEAAGHVLFDFNIMGLLDAIFVSGKTLSESTLNDYAFRLNVPLMNWFVDHLVLSSDGMQIFMQITIVIAEILIGLALMGGLLTTPASAASLALQVMFVCTTGLYLNTMWMIFAAVAVLIGGGRSLGLDYYAMPWLKKHWKRVGFVRKWYLYHD